MNVLEYSKAWYKITRYDLLHKLQIKPQQFEEKVQEVTQQLRLQGYAVFENYFSEEQCEAVRREIDRVLTEYAPHVQVDEQGSDHRLFGANAVSDLINELFWSDTFISQVRNCFYEHDDIVGCTMAARMDAKADNRGSGGGWHRDMVFGRQLKTITYFSDVTPENGPFQFVTNTHKDSSILDTIARIGKEAYQYRFSEAEIARIEALEDYETLTLTGKAGTLMMVDTTSIHRGKPLQFGTRYALTNYWFEKEIPNHIAQLIYKK